jgi:hypothetical protein
LDNWHNRIFFVCVMGKKEAAAERAARITAAQQAKKTQSVDAPAAAAEPKKKAVGDNLDDAFDALIVARQKMEQATGEMKMLFSRTEGHYPGTYAVNAKIEDGVYSDGQTKFVIKFQHIAGPDSTAINKGLWSSAEYKKWKTSIAALRKARSAVESALRTERNSPVPLLNYYGLLRREAKFRDEIAELVARQDRRVAVPHFFTAPPPEGGEKVDVVVKFRKNEHGKFVGTATEVVTGKVVTTPEATRIIREKEQYLELDQIEIEIDQVQKRIDEVTAAMKASRATTPQRKEYFLYSHMAAELANSDPVFFERFNYGVDKNGNMVSFKLW